MAIDKRNEHKTNEYSKVKPGGVGLSPIPNPAARLYSGAYSSAPSYAAGAVHQASAYSQGGSLGSPRQSSAGYQSANNSARPAAPTPHSQGRAPMSYGASSYVKGQVKILPPVSSGARPPESYQSPRQSQNLQPQNSMVPQPASASKVHASHSAKTEPVASQRNGYRGTTAYSTDGSSARRPSYQQAGGAKVVARPSSQYRSASQAATAKSGDKKPSVVGAVGLAASGVAGVASSAKSAASAMGRSNSSSSKDTEKIQSSTLDAARKFQNAGRGVKAARAIAVGVVSTPGAVVRGTVKTAHVAKAGAQGTVAAARYVKNSATGKLVGRGASALANTRPGKVVGRVVTAPARGARAAAGAVNRRIVTPTRNAAATAKRKAGAKVRSTNEKIVKSAMGLSSTREARHAINKAKGKTRQVVSHASKNAKAGAKSVASAAKKGVAGAAVVGGSIKRGVHAVTAPARVVSKTAKVAAAPAASLSRVVNSEDTAKGIVDEATRIATKGVTAPSKMLKKMEKKSKQKLKDNNRKLDKLGKKGEKLAKKKEKLDKKRKNAIKKNDGKAAKRLNKKYDKLAKKKGKLGKKKGKLGKKNGKLQKFIPAMNWVRHPIRNLAKLGAKALGKAVFALAKLLLSNPIVLGCVAGAVLLIFFVLNFSSIISGAGGAVSAISSKFVSGVEGILALDFLPEVRMLQALEEVNWAQYIADKTCKVLGDSFTETAKVDAQNHFASGDNKVQSQMQGEDGTVSYMYNWYCDVSLGTIAHTWMREQCDKVTINDGTVDSSSYSPGGGVSNEIKLYTEGGWLSTHSNEKYHYESYNYEAPAGASFSRLNISPNANIVPIMSMAHDRYNDEWTWENYQSVMAYVYYMYALSHNTAHYDPVFENGSVSDKGTYGYELQDVHRVVMNPGWNWSEKWHEESGTLDRPARKSNVELDMKDEEGNTIIGSGYEFSGCSNIYVHGYNWNALLGSTGAAIKDEMLTGAKKVLGWAGDVLGEDSLGSIMPSQAGVVEVSYTRYRNENDNMVATAVNVNGESYDNFALAKEKALGDDVVQPDGSETYIACDSVYTARFSGVAKCGIEEHIHGAECYTRTCKEEEGHCGHSHGLWCYVTDALGNILDIGDCEHFDCNQYSCSEWVSGHKHGAALTDDDVSECPSEISKDGCTYKLSCEKTQHEHNEWMSFENPGCYNTVMFCMGHCGGHITPTINLAVTYTFEGLAYQDAVSLVNDKHGVTESSFMNTKDFSESSFPVKKTISLWNKHATNKVSQWFSPLPNGPVSALVWLGESTGKLHLQSVGWWNNLVHKWFGGGEDDGNFVYDVDSTSSYSVTDEEEDDMGFEGWFDLSTGTHTMLDESLMEELYSLYGDPSTFYSDGVEMWKEFDVVFNVGMASSMSIEEKNAVMAAIEEAYPDICQERLDVIEDALDHVGSYNYLCTTEGHMNGMYGEMGQSECTGFVSGVYMRALGSKCGFWNGVSNTFTSKTGETGPYNGIWGTTGISYDDGVTPNRGTVKTTSAISPKPGDVVGAPRSAFGGDHGHAMIYLGTFCYDEGEGTNTYVVDCSSGKNGSFFRVAPNNLYLYKNVYSPFKSFGCE